MVGHEHKRRLTIQILISVTVALLEWIHAINATTAHQNQREAMFYSVKSASLIGKVTMTRLVRDEVECATLCYRQYTHNCLSFNFGGISIDDTHICELSNSERALEPQRMQRRKGFDYYGMQKVVSEFFEEGERVGMNSKHVRQCFITFPNTLIKSYPNHLLKTK